LGAFPVRRMLARVANSPHSAFGHPTFEPCPSRRCPLRSETIGIAPTWRCGKTPLSGSSLVKAAADPAGRIAGTCNSYIRFSLAGFCCGPVSGCDLCTYFGGVCALVPSQHPLTGRLSFLPSSFSLSSVHFSSPCSPLSPLFLPGSFPPSPLSPPPSSSSSRASELICNLRDATPPSAWTISIPVRHGQGTEKMRAAILNANNKDCSALGPLHFKLMAPFRSPRFRICCGRPHSSSNVARCAHLNTQPRERPAHHP